MLKQSDYKWNSKKVFLQQKKEEKKRNNNKKFSSLKVVKFVHLVKKPVVLAVFK